MGGEAIGTGIARLLTLRAVSRDRLATIRRIAMPDAACPAPVRIEQTMYGLDMDLAQQTFALFII